MFKVHSVEDAKQVLINNFKNYAFETEVIDATRARGRILSEDVHANCNVPHFKRSTVDGYGVMARDTFGASESMPVLLEITGEVKMGHSAELRVKPDEAVYVPTGGMVPEGADSVVMVEYVDKLDDKNIALYKSVTPKENMIDIGDDIQQGEKVLYRGMKLRPQDIGVLASIGVHKVRVFNMPKIAIISTGDELVGPREAVDIGQIRDINTYTLGAMAEGVGCTINEKVVVKDDFDKLKHHLEIAIEKNDIVLISGGSSVGTKDITKDVIEDMNDALILVHGLSIKPGKPTILAKVKNKVLFGLPGQPVSAMVIFKVFVTYFINFVMDRVEEEPFIEATASVNMPSAQGKETYQMVSLEKVSEQYKAHPVHGKSGMITLLSRANGYIKMAADQEGVNAGEKVRVYLF